MEGVCLIETFRVGSVVDKGHKYICVTVYDIKQIKHLLDASCNLIYESNAIWLQNRYSQVVLKSDGRGGVIFYSWV